MKTDTLTKNKAALHDLMGVVCPCASSKDRRRPFCLPCFRRLPRALRAKFAGIGKSEFVPPGYVEVYSSALEALGLESPFMKGLR